MVLVVGILASLGIGAIVLHAATSKKRRQVRRRAVRLDSVATVIARGLGRWAEQPRRAALAYARLVLAGRVTDTAREHHWHPVARKLIEAGARRGEESSVYVEDVRLGVACVHGLAHHVIEATSFRSPEEVPDRFGAPWVISESDLAGTGLTALDVVRFCGGQLDVAAKLLDRAGELAAAR
ncbi:hypothetical protein GCM10022247_34680 [Allokutzneria multivorans]|uniref:Uncharacterized protein n=1 Tax=Allokutzneria multivorans TaxID=1142134 RepID=A0ABP7SBS8_9PSEU